MEMRGSEHAQDSLETGDLKPAVLWQVAFLLAVRAAKMEEGRGGSSALAGMQQGMQRPQENAVGTWTAAIALATPEDGAFLYSVCQTWGSPDAGCQGLSQG